MHGKSATGNRSFFVLALSALIMTVALPGCSNDSPPSPERYAIVDQQVDKVKSAIANSAQFELITDIDHARLAENEGVVMPPSRLLVVTTPELERAVMEVDQRALVDASFRVLVFESEEGGVSILYNPAEFLVNRYAMPPDAPSVQALQKIYQAGFQDLLNNVDPNRLKLAPITTAEAIGLIDIDSPFDFDETLSRIKSSISEQGDTVWFGELNYQQRLKSSGVEARPTTLLLFGGPKPGGQAMKHSSLLGLDAFCQKVLIWQDESGQVRVTYNDLMAVADRLGEGESIPLRVIKMRLGSTFNNALGL